ncbi:hypothetical protein OSB04_029744 [Centaurea solstitialis]|uniref:Uncharacterized protein n=1 Tax=Centaurea solstitialis TaxID=347529 RepID=A0AA38SII7_9ASTR|nr:hypothetical protein OSB04_029744 [Centaurea solstitialis]
MVNGDSVFVTSNFKEFKAESHGTRSRDERNAMANTASDYVARNDNTTQGDTSLNSDLQLAIALQQHEYDEQQQQPQRVLPQSSGIVVDRPPQKMKLLQEHGFVQAHGFQ